MALPKDQWESIYDSVNSRVYKRSDREYQTLKPYEWSPVIHNYFNALTKLPCSISYKNAKVCPNGEISLKIYEKCTVCLSNFQLVLIDQPLCTDIVTIDCTYEGGFRHCKSSNKRKLIGNKREQLKKKKINENQSPAYVQRVEAMGVMEYGDKEPSHLPSTNALRILKHKALKDEQINSDPVIALSILKGSSPYNNIIRDISYDKFYVHYWASTEINFYRLYAINTDVPRVSIDATGGLVRKDQN
ncbi:unnamed protein product [Macrosiphum euphorbiae]|uniref:Uncharacterized protein n=1 Tax=Macrosiphum euphorbiae TaxID=13131 RepID=A0AAV0Y3K5_9HEMI|nr:unnamed protein product [Macrosiphum euphorbiae]